MTDADTTPQDAAAELARLRTENEQLRATNRALGEIEVERLDELAALQAKIDVLENRHTG